MNRLLAAVATALLLTSHGGTAAAPLVRIQGDVDYRTWRVAPDGSAIRTDDDLNFNQALVPRAITSFAVASPGLVDAVGASVVARVGDGWARFNGTAYSAIGATPVGGEAGGSGTFRTRAVVRDTFTISAAGLNGTPGSAEIGFLVDGVLSAAQDGDFDRSRGNAEGFALVGVDFRQGGSLLGSFVLKGEALNPSPDPGNPAFPDPFVLFNEVLLGGQLSFVYGQPIDYAVVFESEGRARALSQGPLVAATLVSDFGNTITWAGVSKLLDAEGKAITGFTAFSSGGTDFRYRIVPDDVDPPGNVPEPSTALLLLAGLAGLAALSWRRSIVRASGDLAIRR